LPHDFPPPPDCLILVYIRTCICIYICICMHICTCMYICIFIVLYRVMIVKS
jgi:hypothetical protein